LEIPSFLKSRKNIKYKTTSHIKVPKNDKNKIFDLIGGMDFPEQYLIEDKASDEMRRPFQPKNIRYYYIYSFIQYYKTIKFVFCD
jgi:hypothetical protein